MSPLQDRIKQYESIINRYNEKTENNIEPLLQFVMILCKNKNYDGAEEILSNLVESSRLIEYRQIALIWILRSEIAEQLGQLQKSVKLFEQAAKYQAKPFIDVMNAFNSFKQRHAKKSNTDHRNDNKQRNKRIKTNNNNNNNMYFSSSSSSHHRHSKNRASNENTASSEVPCTPLTDDFENFMLSTEKKTKQRRKKFEFRSRQNKNKITSINTLSPIPDIESSDISLSCSFNGPPITPQIPITPKNHHKNNMNNSINNNNMDISGISDISSIGNMSPELPPSTPLTSINTNNLLQSKPKRYSPHSALKSKPPKRYNNENNMDQKGLTVRMELIQLSPSKRRKYDTNKILSPVRRSKRIEKSNDESKELKELLKESNFTFKPNPLL
mmetsp:Transcript_72713/g.65388  ORF Transcript_72713/g.65388 Transcript_72713/m.65388 type:complete len:385 (-) Transcript_72713:105-1259(-)